jgi:phosphate transport system substrate-binding protein
MLHVKRRGQRALLLGALVPLVALVAFACAPAEDEPATPTPAPGQTPVATPTPTVEDRLNEWYRGLRGEVRVDGSSTVFPISQAVAEDFSKAATNVRTKVAFSGTGGGIEKFCRGDIDVANASRPMRQAEKDACAAAGIPEADLVEIKIAIDALTVVVHPQNTWAKCMTTDQLQKAFQADEAGRPIRWNDLNPAWPDQPMQFFFPGAASGTFDYFREAIRLRGAERNEPAHRATGPNATASEDDNILVRGVEGNRYAIGYFGFAFFKEAGAKLTGVEIDGGKGCVAPTFENALDGTYAPLSRPLFIYTSRKLLTERPEVLGFVKFHVENMEELAAEVGYVSLPADLLKEQKALVNPFLPAELRE